MTIELTIEIRARTEKVQELQQTLDALLPAIRKRKPCRECRIYRDIEHGEILLISTCWRALGDLEEFLRSGNGTALLGAIDLLSETTAVKTGRAVPWRGVDTLKRMRTAK